MKGSGSRYDGFGDVTRTVRFHPGTTAPNLPTKIIPTKIC